MTDVTLTVSTIVRDRSWLGREDAVAAELTAELQQQAKARGVHIHSLTELDIVVSEMGTWARFTLSATAS